MGADFFSGLQISDRERLHAALSKKEAQSSLAQSSLAQWPQQCRSATEQELTEIFSGLQSGDRERLVAILGVEESSAAEEVVDIPDNEETNAAAAKMQALQRGKAARKEVEAKRTAKATEAQGGDGAPAADGEVASAQVQ